MDTMTESFWSALGGPADVLTGLAPVVGAGSLPSFFRVTDLATATISAAGLALAELITELTGSAPTLTVDRALASGWFGTSFRPVGWTVPSPVGRARRRLSRRGRLDPPPHQRSPPPRRRVACPGCRADRDAVAAAVALWQPRALEAAIVADGGCAAAMHSEAEWVVHPQGAAVAGEPLVDWSPTGHGSISEAWQPSGARPLAGLRVLDLTRVIAGPVATRFLAGFGADVLRIDPPDWDEPAARPRGQLRQALRPAGRARRRRG